MALLEKVETQAETADGAVALEEENFMDEAPVVETDNTQMMRVDIEWLGGEQGKQLGGEQSAEAEDGLAPCDTGYRG